MSVEKRDYFYLFYYQGLMLLILMNGKSKLTNGCIFIKHKDKNNRVNSLVSRL